MDQIDWRLLKILYQEKSMVKAAEQLFISQPAISYRLTRMENEFGQSLFVRTNRGVEMTSAGLRLYSFANLMIQYDDQIHHTVNRSGSDLSGNIRIGTTETMVIYSLATQMKEFTTQYPNITISLQIAATPDLLRMIRSGSLMMCTIRGAKPEDGNAILIFDEPLVIVSSEPITEEMIHTKPLLRNIPGTDVVQIIDEWLGSHFDSPPTLSPITLEGSSRCVVSLVKAGLGWGVISASRYHASGEQLYWTPICQKDGTPYLYHTYLYYSEEAAYFDTYMAYANHLQEFFRTHQFPD